MLRQKILSKFPVWGNVCKFKFHHNIYIICIINSNMEIKLIFKFNIIIHMYNV